MKFIAFIIVVFLCSCKGNTEYPDGGYEYPKNITDNDTNFYAYPIKSNLKKGEAFYYSYEYLIYRPFNEPNLSLRSLGTEIYRLTYSTTFGETIIMVLENGALTVKKGEPALLYEHDTSRLTPKENYLLRLLSRYYPIDTTGKEPRQKKYLDSMIKEYPQLQDSTFYHMLFEKSFFIKKEKILFKEDKLNLPRKQYDSIINEINSSGFWKLPYKNECYDDAADGAGFTLEANSKYKFQIVSVGSCTENGRKLSKVCEKIFYLATKNQK